MNAVFQLAVEQLSLKEAKEVVAILEKKQGKTLNPISQRRKEINEAKKLFQ